MDGREETVTTPLRIPGRLGELERQVAELTLALKRVNRDLRKAEEHHQETEQAYQKMVGNLVQTTQENLVLRHECQRLRQQARAEAPSSPNPTVSFGIRLTPEEVAVVRKAIARLHHPDAGGDVSRMQEWNVALDALLD